jgi:RimJ/RimL family protein N-acetyltransferase
MDNYVDVLEVQHSEHDGSHFHTSAVESVPLTVDDLSLLRLDDLEKVDEILQLYNETAVPRENITLFQQHLVQRLDSWFVAVADVGLIYLTNVIPTFSANLQVIFWDRKFGAVRRQLVQRVLGTAFQQFALTRVQALVPVTNKALATTEMRKIGFVQEGQLRKAWREEGEDHDMVVFSILRSECSWEPVSQLCR